MTLYEFEIEIKKVLDIDRVYVEIPFHIKAEFEKIRVKLCATFDGESYRYRESEYHMLLQ